MSGPKNPENSRVVLTGLEAEDFRTGNPLRRSLASVIRQTVPKAKVLPLPVFGRIVVLCGTEAEARDLAETIKRFVAGTEIHKGIEVAVVATNNVAELRESFRNDKTGHSEFQSDGSGFLKIPERRKFLLVSPPPSPPPGFDFSQLEEGPNPHPVSLPDEFTNILFRKLGDRIEHFDPSPVSVEREEPKVGYNVAEFAEKMRCDSSGHPVIIVEAWNDERKQLEASRGSQEGSEVQFVKTAMPPM